MFRQDVDFVFILIAFGPEFNLRQDLVCKGRGHHKRGVARGISKIQQPAFRK